MDLKDKGLIAAFRLRLKNLMEVNVAADASDDTSEPTSAATTTATRGKSSAKKAKESRSEDEILDDFGTLQARVHIFFELIAEGIAGTWAIAPREGEIHVVPFPRLSAALGPCCSWPNIVDFTMTFDLPDLKPSPRCFFNVCTQLEECLSLLEAPLFDNGEFEGMGIDARIRAFQRKMSGELRPSRKRSASSPPPPDTSSSEPRKGSMPPPRPNGFGSTSGFSTAGFATSAPWYPPPTPTKPSRPTTNGGKIDIGQGSTNIDPDEKRRLTIEAMGKSAGCDAPNRAAAIAMMEAFSRETPPDGVHSLAAQMTRERNQQRCGLGVGVDGSGSMNFGAAPEAVQMAVILGRGDDRIKVQSAGVAIAPGVSFAIQTAIQTGARGQGVFVTLKEATLIIQQQYYKIGVLSLIVRSIGECGIGDATKPAPKINPEDDPTIPGGEDIINFLENLVMCREFFDRDSQHTNDLRAIVHNVKVARRQNFRVRHVWPALKTMFQCYHQQLTLYASTSVVMAMPRLTGSFEASDRLWAKGSTHAMTADSVDGAWRQSSLDATSTPAHGNLANRNAYLNSLSPANRKAVAKILRGDDDDYGRGKGHTRDLNKAKVPKVSTPGDDIVKSQGDALWPQHINKCCKWYKLGKSCHSGKACKMYCYLTKAAAKYSN